MVTLTSTAAVAQKQHLTACFSDWYPYSYIKDDKATGLSIEIYSAAIKRAGLEIVYEHRPWKRCRIEVSNGIVDAAVDGGIKIENTLNANKRPVPWVILVWVKQNSAYQKFEGYSQFKSKHIAYVRGYGYPQDFFDYKGFKKSSVTKDLHGLKVLQGRDVDAFFGDLVNNTQLVKLHDLNVRSIGPAISISMLTLSFHNSLLQEHSRFEVALNEMYKDGSIDIFYNKYLGTTYDEFMNKYSISKGAHPPN